MLKAIGGAVLVVGQDLAKLVAEVCCYYFHAVTMGAVLGLTLGSIGFAAWGMMATASSCSAQITYLTEILPRLASVPRHAGPRD